MIHTFRCALVALSCHNLLALAQSSSPSLEAPAGGWTATAPVNNFAQDVTYPASRVNARSGSPAQIRGNIVRQPKSDKPALLIVNGVPMPLETDEAGNFARPYSFASGSNSLEVRKSGESTGRRVQFYDAAAGGVRAQLRIVLNWDSAGTDMDLHVISPSGQHCFYGNRVIQGGGALDVDVTTGYGPEIFATARPERGTWHVYVNFYGGGDRASAVSTVQVAVITAEGKGAETRRTYRLPLRASGELKHVASFSVL